MIANLPIAPFSTQSVNLNPPEIQETGGAKKVIVPAAFPIGNKSG